MKPAAAVLFSAPHIASLYSPPDYGGTVGPVEGVPMSDPRQHTTYGRYARAAMLSVVGG